jgi:hypothetical protein
VRRRRLRDDGLSWTFWRGCGAIVMLSGVDYATLVTGTYRNIPSAPTVEPVPALFATTGLACVAFVALWSWERRARSRRR